MDYFKPSETHKYDDIIHLEHPEPKYHRRMAPEMRAAQFAPFAALSGYEEAVRETERTTEKFRELTEEEKNILNRKFEQLSGMGKPEVEVTYFVPDKSKEGGSYVTVKGFIDKIDVIHKGIMINQQWIATESVSDIRSDAFDCMEC